MNPLVSIIVTCYNYGNFVAETLCSLQEQSFSDFEVIVVDDGSTDDSEQQIRPFLQDNRFRYVKQKNGGQANAKNKGIQESTARLIAFLDADDKWKPEKLEKQVPLFNRLELGVIYSRCHHIDSQGRLLPSLNYGQLLSPRRGKVTKYLFYDNFVPFSSVIVRKECFNTLGVFDESLSMGIDWDLWLRFSTRYQFDYCEEAFLLYRVGHSGQMSKNMLERIRCADKIKRKFLQNFPDALPEVTVKDAAYYSYCLRAYALRKYGIRYPLENYLKAIVLFPFRKKAYLGLIKTPVRAMLGK